MKTKVLTFLIVLFMFGGAGLLAYPTVSDWYNANYTSHVTAGYENVLDTVSQDDLDAARAEADEFNVRLRTIAERWTLDEETSAEYYGLLDLSGTGVMAVLSVPKAGIELPVYHGDDEAVLQVAAGHVEGSSLPVGGKGSHAVISGHTGLPRAKLFNALDTLEAGDRFIVTTLKEDLVYQVVDVNVVLPREMDYLAIDPERDLVTLLTCTPYGVNSHRLLVTGERIQVEDHEQLAAVVEEVRREKQEPELEPALFILAGAAAFILFVLAATRPRKRGKKKKKGAAKTAPGAKEEDAG